MVLSGFRPSLYREHRSFRLFSVCSRLDRNATMTPYEALLWHAWLPKIRSAIK